MTSILPPAADGRLFERWLRSRRKIVGVLVDAGLPVAAEAGVDFLVLAADAPIDAIHAALGRHRGRLPVLLLADSAAQLEQARAAGADGIIAAAGAGLSGDEIAVELSDRGRARVVSSPTQAAEAFRTGADVVLYDLRSAVSALVAEVVRTRPPLEDLGARPTLVLLSGMLGDASLWDGVIGQLPARIRPWSSRIDLDDSIAEMAASVLAEAPPRFALAGHSLGAIVAMEIMRQQPERVSRLALVNASARGPSPAQLEAWVRARARLDDGEFAAVADELASATLPPERRADAQLVAANRRMADAVGAQGFARQLAAQITRPDSLDSVGDIAVPVLVVSGERDEVCPPALQHELAARCPGAVLVSIAGGHMLPLECPEAVGDTLATWLGTWLAAEAGAEAPSELASVAPHDTDVELGRRQ